MEATTHNKVKPILSICIPTYNRSEYLREALENITSDLAFNEQVEVVISDNASSDNTKEVAEEFCSRFENIHYFCNEKNIKDANFSLSLKRGSGKYRKLCNDTCRFKEGKLEEIIRNIQKNKNESPIFFYPNLPFLDKGVYNCSGVNDFLSKVGYFVGWILTFGLYENDLDCLNVDPKYERLQFSQVAWALEIINKHHDAKLVIDDFYYSVSPKGKGGYNLFKVQVSNLFCILSEYGLKGKEYDLQKYKLFKYQVVPLMYEYLIKKEKTAFDLSDSWIILFKEYGSRPYFYFHVIYSYLRYLKNKILRHQ